MDGFKAKSWNIFFPVVVFVDGNFYLGNFFGMILHHLHVAKRCAPVISPAL